MNSRDLFSSQRLLGLLTFAIACAFFVWQPSNVLAQTLSAVSDYPNRPIRWVLGFATGGSGDALARLMAPEVGRRLGQNIVIENRPGAATNLASENVAKSAADGYSLLMGGSFSHSVNPSLFAKLPYDAQKDFTPIIKIGSGPTLFVVPANLPVKSLTEFIAYAKKEGNKVNYASAGIGSPGHIAGAYFNQTAGLDMTHVPYKGSSEAVRDLVAGSVQLIITSGTSVAPMLAQGRVRALALTTPKRSKVFPDVPGSEEAGLKNFNIDGWYGVFAPANLPPAIAAKLFAAFKGAMEDLATKEKLEATGMTIETSPSSIEFTRFVRDDAAAFVGVVKASGARID